MMMLRLLFLLIVVALPSRLPAQGRYFHEGNGRISVVNGRRGNGGTFRYRLDDGGYSRKALRRLNRLFGVPKGSRESVSVRLIAMLDHLEDHLGAEHVVVLSAFRSRVYNEMLRKKGVSTAKTSLHMDGMAADVLLEGVSAFRAWQYLRNLECCGAGYYHGDSIHLDTGPSRFWVTETSGVDRDPPPANRIVITRTDRDVYRPGDPVRIKLARLSHYPIGVEREVKIIKGDVAIGTVSLDNVDAACHSIAGPRERTLELTIPEDIRPRGRVQIEVRFCTEDFSEMPKRKRSNPFSIRSPFPRFAPPLEPVPPVCRGGASFSTSRSLFPRLLRLRGRASGDGGNDEHQARQAVPAANATWRTGGAWAIGGGRCSP